MMHSFAINTKTESVVIPPYVTRFDAVTVNNKIDPAQKINDWMTRNHCILKTEGEYRCTWEFPDEKTRLMFILTWDHLKDGVKVQC